MTLSIEKVDLAKYVNAKLKQISYVHIVSVMSILFEEIVVDLLNGKDIEIHKFGTLSLVQMADRKYLDYRFKEIMEAKGKKAMRFFLARKIKKILCQAVDLDRLFFDD
jgi:nucleoid DNA-binding protein